MVQVKFEAQTELVQVYLYYPLLNSKEGSCDFLFTLVSREKGDMALIGMIRKLIVQLQIMTMAKTRVRVARQKLSQVFTDIQLNLLDREIKQIFNAGRFTK